MMNMRGHNRPPFQPKVPGTDIRSDDVPTAIIYCPSRALTSAARARHWVLEFEPARAPEIEPLMGWTASADPYRAIRMVFPDRESAVGFAESQDWRYIVREDQPKRPKRNSWAGTSRNRLYKGVDAPGACRTANEATAHQLHFGHDTEQANVKRQSPVVEAIDPVIEASLESFPASDPPAWTGATIVAGSQN